jgi:hypothetical protein
MSEPLRRTVRVRCPLAHAFDVFTAREKSSSKVPGV